MVSFNFNNFVTFRLIFIFNFFSGPSVPKILGLDKKEIFQCSEGWVPVYTDNTQLLGVVSIGFLLKSDDDAVIWRGPKKHMMIKQFIQDVYWGDLDVLLVDTPPGTSDEHISLVEFLMASSSVDGAILVTTPQQVALSDVRKEISFCKKMQLPIVGVIENMSGFLCPCCQEVTYIFSTGGGLSLQQEFQIPFLGSIPIDPKLSECEDVGKDYVKEFSKTSTANALKTIAEKILTYKKDKSE